jgi:hypothetical protein
MNAFEFFGSVESGTPYACERNITPIAMKPASQRKFTERPTPNFLTMSAEVKFRSRPAGRE